MERLDNALILGFRDLVCRELGQYVYPETHAMRLASTLRWRLEFRVTNLALSVVRFR